METTTREKNQQIVVIGMLDLSCGMAYRFQWRDGIAFFHTSIRHIRKQIKVSPEKEHSTIEKWCQQVLGVLDEKEIWSSIWWKNKESKINHFSPCFLL